MHLAQTTPPPKLGEGSPAVARNERKAGRRRGPPRTQCDVRRAPSTAHRMYPREGHAPSGRAPLAHLPQKPLGEVVVSDTAGRGDGHPAVRRRPPSPTPSPVNCTGEGENFSVFRHLHHSITPSLVHA